MTMSGSLFRGPLVAAALVAATSFSGSVDAQSGRLSLAERVTRLESQNEGQGSGQSTVDLLNRIDELQSEVQSLRGLVEQQAFEIEELKKRGRDQYVDLDSRISRLEGNPVQATTAPPSEPASTGQFQDVPTAPAAPGQLTMEAPVDPVAPPPTPQLDAVTGAELEAARTPIDASSTPVPPPATTTTNIPQAGEQASYDTAFDALREGRYAESARRFSAFLEQYPEGELADNATYWLGESYYVTQNYQIALDTFRSLLARFPQSAKTQDAMLKVGYCLYELKQWGEAEAALNDVVARYPDTTVSRLAQGRLRALRLEGKTP
jgi:tol-pal system protein YbgF